ncbi:MAG: hypothetical protein H6714_07800 [Myxococcales bacterium]|nr:hypothetical protein [Myxococcales bacterium]
MGTRFWYPLAVLALFIMGSAFCVRLAHAQIKITQTGVEGRDANTNQLSNVPLSKEECKADVVISFLIEQIPTTRTRLDFWQGRDCNTTLQRSPTGDCKQLDVGTVEINNLARFTLDLHAQSLFTCDASATPTIFVLAIDSTNDEVSASEFGSLQLSIDATAPSAPASVEGKSGDTEIPVSWDTPGGENVHGYTVYVDATQADCTSTLLIADQPRPEDTSSLITATANGNATSAVIKGDKLAYDQKAAVAVVARDISGNESLLSNVSCVTREHAYGIWNLYCIEKTGQPDCPSDGCALSAGSASGFFSSSSFALGCLMMLWIWRRRMT